MNQVFCFAFLAIFVFDICACLGGFEDNRRVQQKQQKLNSKLEEAANKLKAKKELLGQMDIKVPRQKLLNAFMDIYQTNSDFIRQAKGISEQERNMLLKEEQEKYETFKAMTVERFTAFEQMLQQATDAEEFEQKMVAETRKEQQTQQLKKNFDSGMYDKYAPPPSPSAAPMAPASGPQGSMAPAPRNN